MESCPTNNQEYENAANFKNCKLTASQQKCSDADKFVYHCVIDGFENETLEVCAPQKIITGILFKEYFLKCVEFKTLLMIKYD